MFSYVAEHGGIIAQGLVPAGIPRDNCQVLGHNNRDILYLTTSSIVKSQYRNRIRHTLCYRSRIASAGEGKETEEEMKELRIKRLHGVTTRSTIL